MSADDELTRVDAATFDELLRDDPDLPELRELGDAGLLTRDELRDVARYAGPKRRFVQRCTCACASGGFCGGCGHAGCGGRG